MTTPCTPQAGSNHEDDDNENKKNPNNNTHPDIPKPKC